jgi:hypothetical protein
MEAVLPFETLSKLITAWCKEPEDHFIKTVADNVDNWLDKPVSTGKQRDGCAVINSRSVTQSVAM